MAKKTKVNAKAKKTTDIIEAPMAHNADMRPESKFSVRRHFKKQGKLSFLDEFYTLYRRWVKNE